MHPRLFAMKHCGLLTALLMFATPGLLPDLAAAETKAPYAWPLTTANGLFHLWLPKDAPAIKGLLVFPYHGTGEQWSESPEVQDLAKELAYVLSLRPSNLQQPTARNP